jgi:AraC family transcriptional regulator of adaptative response/methylated-DNA-[protein]-cysteine methyltransferase
LTDRGICSLHFHAPEETDLILADLKNTWPGALFESDPEQIGAIVEEILAPAGPDSIAPQTLLVKGTNFQLQVWRALLRIPSGFLLSYEDLATWIGRPDAVRAVSSAVARNPIGYLIPCHRVIRKSGAVGKYHWGNARKKALIGREAAEVWDARPHQLSVF